MHRVFRVGNIQNGDALVSDHVDLIAMDEERLRIDAGQQASANHARREKIGRVDQVKAMSLRIDNNTIAVHGDMVRREPEVEEAKLAWAARICRIHDLQSCVSPLSFLGDPCVHQSSGGRRFDDRSQGNRTNDRGLGGIEGVNKAQASVLRK